MKNLRYSGLLAPFALFLLSGCLPRAETRNGVEHYRSAMVQSGPTDNYEAGNRRYTDVHHPGEPDGNLDEVCEIDGDRYYACTLIIDEHPKYQLFIPRGHRVIARGTEEAKKLQNEFEGVKSRFRK